MFRKLFIAIKKIVPVSLRKQIKDVLESVERIWPGTHEGLERYDLLPTQVYPKGNNLYSVLVSATKYKLRGLHIDKKTPVASIGSCFAEEFAFFMEKNGYNYIRTEGDVFAASANWGRVYTIPNLLQIVKYSTDKSYPVVVEKCMRGWFDPLRESMDGFYLNKNEAECAINSHREASYKALVSCEVLIITLGQNQTWIDNSNSQVWVRIPPSDIMKSRRDDFSVAEIGYHENVSKLNEIVSILCRINPEIKILFTVSPVAAYATFTDPDVISNSFANKCILRSVVKEVVEREPDRLYYFPSFEMVLCDNQDNFRADNRHVKYATVDRIFSLFVKSMSV